jgi:hypothetical protein
MGRDPAPRGRHRRGLDDDRGRGPVAAEARDGVVQDEVEAHRLERRRLEVAPATGADDP